MIKTENLENMIRVYEDDPTKIITLYDGENIEDYSGSYIFYVPTTFDIAKFKEIDLEEHNRILAEVEENNQKKIEEQENELRTLRNPLNLRGYN